MIPQELNKVLDIIGTEEELAGEIPNEFYEHLYYANKDELTLHLRRIVRATKESISKRIKKEFII